MPPEIEGTIAAIRYVRNPRYLATERGYHGAFYCALLAELEAMNLVSEQRILEMEHQKTARRHGTGQRPDIILHIPVEISGGEVWENNYAVWALKHSGTSTDASADFRKFNDMCQRLRYPLAIFINIASSATHLNRYRGRFPDRIHSFAVPSLTGTTIKHSFFENGKICEKSYPIRIVT